MNKQENKAEVRTDQAVRVEVSQYVSEDLSINYNFHSYSKLKGNQHTANMTTITTNILKSRFFLK